MTMTTFSLQGIPVLFDELADQLVSLGGDGHPSEIHGFLAGLFSAGSPPTCNQWQAQLAEQWGDKTINDSLAEMLTRLYSTMLGELENGDFSLQLLLPDDEDELAQRTEALGIWCQSFISGFGQGLQKQEVGDVVEDVLRDFGEISLIEAADDSEESEKLFMEVSEFVRMAWLTVYTDIHGRSENNSSKKEKKQKKSSGTPLNSLH